jgi:hypothetical protein
VGSPGWASSVSGPTMPSTVMGVDRGPVGPEPFVEVVLPTGHLGAREPAPIAGLGRCPQGRANLLLHGGRPAPQRFSRAGRG